MKKKKKIIVVISIILFLLVLFLVVVNSKFVLIKSVSSTTYEKIGIIDGHLSENHRNIVMSNMDSLPIEKSHGDKVLDFVSTYNNKISMYYYDAEFHGKIDSTSLLEGLAWMKDNGVTSVSISLSGKFDDEELETWIEQNSDRIFVSNRIIIWGKNGISEYEGNSFLTPYVMIKDLLDK